MTRHRLNVSAVGDVFYARPELVDAMLKMNRWDTSTSTAITFSFPDSVSHYPAFSQYASGLTGNTFVNGFSLFQQATPAVQATVRNVLTSQFAAVANLTFQERASGNSQLNGTAPELLR